jgi:hypothetical protein
MNDAGPAGSAGRHTAGTESAMGQVQQSQPRAEQRRRPGGTRAKHRTDDPTLWLGWVVFVSIMLFAAGLITVVQGLVALFDEAFYLTSPSGLAVGADYQVWGVALLVVGAALLAGGVGVLTGRGWGRVIGVVAVAINMLVNLAFASAFPHWTVLVVSLDVITIYALVIHGGEAKALRTDQP